MKILHTLISVEGEGVSLYDSIEKENGVRHA